MQANETTTQTTNAGEPHEVDVVAFQLADKTYAMPLASVSQILPMMALTPLPQTHRAVEGVMNFRGRAVPVVNMRRYMDLPDAPLRLHTPIVLAYVQERLMGLLVDDVVGLLSFQRERVAALADMMPESLGEVPLLEGLVHLEQDTMLLLNLDHLFSARQAKALARAVADLSLTKSPRQPPAQREPALAAEERDHDGR